MEMLGYCETFEEGKENSIGSMKANYSTKPNAKEEKGNIVP
jgi:hypothetical protein